MELVIKNISGKDSGKKVTLKKEIYGIEPNDNAIYLEVKQHLANSRQGTHSSLEVSDLSGSTRKIKKQKGTGTARMGSIKSPLLRGGARAFGPKPRDYSFKLNRKLKQLAKKSALSYKAKEGNIVVVEDFKMKDPKTQEFVGILENLKVADKKNLLVLGEANKNIYLSARNLSKSLVVSSSELSTYDILNADNLVLSLSSVAFIDDILS